MGPGEAVEVDVLLGTDWYWRVVTGHMKRLSSFLMATETIFGWLLQGSTQTYESNNALVSLLCTAESSSDCILDSQLKSIWDLDQSGILSKEEKSPLTLEEVEVQEKFEKTIFFKDNRYQVEIPWANNKSDLCKNFFMAKERLKRLLLKLQNDDKLLERYRAGVYEYLKNGHSEEVSLETSSEFTYYMPHHPIIREDRKTTKLRIVFDASSKSGQGSSLNQCQYAGPNLNPSIFSLLLRFRWHKVAISSDVEKAFLQIELKEHERDVTRFLWTDEKWSKDSEPTLKVFRMVSVLFGMKSSPYLLAATIRHHVRTHPDSNPRIQRLISDNSYVDDFLSGSKSTQEAYDISNQANSLMAKGGFMLKKWATNDTPLRKLWQRDGIITESEPIELLKVLGLMWDPSTDFLSLKSTTICSALDASPNTKRGILETLARVFDPLGFISPKLVSAKCLLQDVWRLKLSWDQKLPEDLILKWESWKQDLVHLQQVSFSRWYGSSDDISDSYQLHIFCDASPKCYGAVAYLRMVDSNSVVTTSFVTSKSRIAPLEVISIPRLELMACLIGSRLADSIRHAWGKEDLTTFLWADSKVALEWLKGTPTRWKLFVGRRVQEIQSLTSKDKWNYCCSKNNVADHITRGMSLKNLLASASWWKGPTWLLEDFEDSSSEIPSSTEVLDLIHVEEVAKVVSQTLTVEEPLLHFSKFSSWSRLIRVTAWIFRFIQNCKVKVMTKNSFLSCKELEFSTNYWLKKIQELCFPEEVKALTKNSQVDTKSRILQFNPFLDDFGLIRLGGRLKFADLNEEQKHPILLSYNYLVKLLILDNHGRTLHGGIQVTLIQLRKFYWILKGRQSIRKALRDCLVCRKWSAKPAVIIEAPLPAARINKAMPFEVSGVDFAGPCWFKDGSDRKKSYICLFTCAVTRAVHLELVSSQGIKPFLLAFRRFLARRGKSRIIYSDNAKTFQQADFLLREAWSMISHEDIQNEAANQGIEWRFIAPQAAWWGGFYERLVGSVKRHLRRSLGSALLTFEELTTLLVEIEAVINSRPLVSMTEDSTDTEYISPSHFLIGYRGGSLSDFLPGITDSIPKKALQKRWLVRKQLINTFWSKWTNEYLLQLQSAHKLNVPTADSSVKINDVVLLKDERFSRGRWKMGRIVELTEGRDGKVRSVMLQTSNRNIIRRAIQKICPLELV